jgi:hypothetical protein
VDCIHLAQDKDQWRALMYTVMNPRAPYSMWNFLTGIATISFTRTTLFDGVRYIEVNVFCLPSYV